MRDSLECDRRMLLAGVGVAGAALAARAAHSGPLTSPAGLVAPTMKPLDVVEPRIPIESLPFTISQPGSYYLAGDLTGAPGQHGITINADDVTLDLNGFALRGVSGSLSGVFVPDVAIPNNIKIFNGVVNEWGQSGIDAFAARNSQVIGIRAHRNTSNGIMLGDGGMIAGCTARENGAVGIRGSSGLSISQCATSVNGSHGVQVNSDTTIRAVASNGNAGSGIVGFEHTLADNCAFDFNALHGATLGADSTVTNSLANSNDGDGINTAFGALIENCIANANGSQTSPGDGIDVQPGSVVRGCVARQNSDNGIEVSLDGQSLVESCTTTGNGGFGIFANNSLVHGCVSLGNTSLPFSGAGSTLFENHGF